MKQQASEEANNERLISEAESQVAEVEDVEALKQALAKAKEKAEANLAGWQRAQADFINYKRRNEQEMAEVSQFANATLMLSLLPILDDLERAFAAIPPRLAKASWIDGVRLIWRKLQTTLEAQGLTPIKALGEPFDPNFHEAVRQDKGKEGVVVGELLKGYKLHDKIIRAARVVVGNGEEEEKKEE
jgi:molecular chaperone GrpE